MKKFGPKKVLLPIIPKVIVGASDRLWPFILEAYKRDLPDKMIAVLAAGPLEDLLDKRGEDFIDRIEELARTDPKFKDLLGGVWRTTMTEEVWQRVQAVRTHVGEPANTPETKS